MGTSPAPGVEKELERYGLLAQLGPDSVFASVGDVIDARKEALERHDNSTTRKGRK